MTYTVDEFLDGRVTLFGGDNRVVMIDAEDNSIDAILTDGPYALVSIVKRFGGANAAPAKGNAAFTRASKGFMGKTWDTGEVVNSVEFWAECLRVLKPGGHLLSFGGTRTYHRMACAVEDAGFEIRDMIQWLYGSGFPKSHDVSKGIDKAAGVERTEKTGIKPGHEGFANRETSGDTKFKDGMDGFDRPWMSDPNAVDRYHHTFAPATDEAKEWQGWGTALKPANEPIVLARKPLSEKTVAANVLKWGTGAINIDACRVGTEGARNNGRQAGSNGIYGVIGATTPVDYGKGRFPANVITDGSDEVVAAFPVTGGNNEYSANEDSAARFFYQAKANKKDRAGSKHPTVKPIALMRYLAKLITPPGGTILDPFAGSGTTGEAAYLEGFNCYLIEMEADYREDIVTRFNALAMNDNVAPLADAA